jgi:ankyrin repeat protein
VLYDYACTYWATHLRLSRASADKRIPELLAWFLVPEQHSGWYESWQQMYHHDIEHYCRGRPPLHYAIEFGIDFLRKALLLAKHEVNTLYNGMATLHEAAKCGDLDTCVSLLNLGASLELSSGPNKRSMTALHFAAEEGHSAVIELLLARGSSPHTRSASQATPFFRAARSGSLEALRILYLAGSDINARTWDNWTPLFESVIRGLANIANQLLQWGPIPRLPLMQAKALWGLFLQP